MAPSHTIQTSEMTPDTALRIIKRETKSSKATGETTVEKDTITTFIKREKKGFIYSDRRLLLSSTNTHVASEPTVTRGGERGSTFHTVLFVLLKSGALCVWLTGEITDITFSSPFNLGGKVNKSRGIFAEWCRGKDRNGRVMICLCVISCFANKSVEFTRIPQGRGRTR